MLCNYDVGKQTWQVQRMFTPPNILQEWRGFPAMLPHATHNESGDFPMEVEQRIVSTLLGHGAYYPLAGSTSFKAKPYGMDASEVLQLFASGIPGTLEQSYRKMVV